jgi:hypothetical protein
MSDNAIICAGCARPVGTGGVILVTASPLPLASAGRPVRASVLKAMALSRTEISEARQNVYCGKACALARLDAELDAILGIARAPHLAAGCTPSAGRVRYIPCAYAPGGCPCAYRRRMRWEGADCMEVLTCGETHTPVAELAECPLTAGCTPSAASRIACGSDATAPRAEHPHTEHPDAEDGQEGGE